ncbi:MAG TPA: SpoIIE family protein phosphatase, partial [Chloroflexota bacterium]
ATPLVTERALERGDRVLFFTDGVIEEDRRSGAEVGETRLRLLIERVSEDEGSVQETVRLLSRALMLERGGVTSDDATLLLLEWRGGTVDDLAIPNAGPS